MSLLMDALKKAEQEKREAAKRLEQTGEQPVDAQANAAGEPTGEHEIPETESPSTTQPLPHELSLEPIEARRASEQKPEPRTQTTDERPPVKEAPVTIDSGASENETVILSMGEPAGNDASAALELESGDRARVESDRDLSADGDATPDADQTFHGIEIDTGPAVPGMFEETVRDDSMDPLEGRPTYDETLPGVPAAQMARDIGDKDQPTPVAAETVFTAGRGRSDPSAGLKGLLIGLVVVVLVATGVWYYYVVTPVARDVGDPYVARGIETIVPAEPLDLPVPREQGAAPGALPAPVPGEVAAASADTGTAAEGAAATKPGAETPGAVAADDAAPAPSAAGAGEADAAEADTGAGSSEAVAQATPAEPVSREPAPVAQAGTAAEHVAATGRIPQPPPALIRISRSTGPSNTGRLLQEAYANYQAGDLTGAGAHYAAVLEDHPDNIDALLGMATISMRKDELRRGLEYYSRVLKLDPRNEPARAVMLGLMRDTNPLAGESALKSMIHESPDKHFLHFTLGNLFAAQRRWADAQQAYFDAYRHDSSNPDYAMNLAVSLDRMGQSETALDYYNVALKLAQDRPANFDAASVRTRIASLSGAADPQP